MSRTGAPSWMTALRAAARARFDAMAWPTTSEEEWRRTDLSKLKLDGYAAGAGGACTVSSGPDAAAAAAGAILVALADAPSIMEAPLHATLEEELQSADNRFVAWNLAHASHGAVLWVPAGVALAAPIVIDLDESAEAGAAAAAGRAAHFPRVQVALGAGARAELILRLRGDGALTDAAVDLRLEDGAVLSFLEDQRLGAGAVYVRHTRARLGKGARLSHLDVQLGASLVKARAACILAGEEADADLHGVYFGARGQHVDLRTVQAHASGSATSRAHYKGAVAPGGRTVYQGLIDVSPGASKTDAFLTNRNLVLGDAARADSIPTLRIANNDVKCSHGSTTGRLDPNELFYLQSRGFSPVDARETLVVGYFEELLAPLPEAFREDALATVRDRLRSAA